MFKLTVISDVEIDQIWDQLHDVTFPLQIYKLITLLISVLQLTFSAQGFIFLSIAKMKGSDLSFSSMKFLILKTREAKGQKWWNDVSTYSFIFSLTDRLSISTCFFIRRIWIFRVSCNKRSLTLLIFVIPPVYFIHVVYCGRVHCDYRQTLHSTASHFCPSKASISMCLRRDRETQI